MGKNDELGQAKYALNLDEVLVGKFYQMIKDDEQTIINNLEDEEDDHGSVKALQSIIL